jgi:hypothetical protein
MSGNTKGLQKVIVLIKRAMMAVTLASGCLAGISTAQAVSPGDRKPGFEYRSGEEPNGRDQALSEEPREGAEAERLSAEPAAPPEVSPPPPATVRIDDGGSTIIYMSCAMFGLAMLRKKLAL